MRVAVALDGVVFGGAERYLEVLLEGLAADGAEVLVVAPAQAEPQLLSRLAAHADMAAVPGLARRPTAPAVLAVRRSISRWRPDVVHLNLTDQGDGLGLVAATASLRRPCVLTLHNAIPGPSPTREALSAGVLRRADRVLAVSEAIGRYASSAGARVQVVHNGLAAVPAHPDPRGALGLPPEGPVVGGVGRLRAQKGFEVLGQAALLLDRPGVRFVVVGDGEERHRLEEPDCRLLELAGPREDAAALMGAFTVLAVPSRYEAFGLVAVEAMHAGIPVVASRVGGLPEVVGDAGVLVPPEDPQALAEALAGLLDDPAASARLTAAGRARAAAIFTPEAMVAGVQQVYRAVRRGGS
jgi:glycosyltransferase involved in cell wall biosynthesis